jgi:hypothetical protein
MQNLKKVIKNAQINGRSKEQELQLFLRAYRATSHSVTKVTPSILLMTKKRLKKLFKVLQI